MFNTVTQGKELPSNDSMLVDKREVVTHDLKQYEIVVKSSKKPLVKLNGHTMYSCAQIIDNENKECFHELYASILSELQANRIIGKLRSEIGAFINQQY